MNYEKKYKEALERARGAHNSAKSDKENGITDKITEYTIQLTETIFPELKESEDEKMRKSIIYALQNGGFYDNDKTDEAIAWLEKQGDKDSQVIFPSFTFDDILALQCCMETVKKVQEDKDLYEKLKDMHGRVYDAYQLEKQNDNADKVEHKDYNNIDPHFGKPIDKVEPKFNLYDWVVTDKGDTVQIGAFNNGYYTMYNGMDFNMSYVDKCWHRWTIEDAKDGDVLCYKDEISLYKHDIKNCTKQEPNFGGFVYYCCYDGKRFIVDSLYSLIEQDKMDIHPATKEQHDNLFQKMKEAGYKWDKDKKELIKL